MLLLQQNISVATHILDGNVALDGDLSDGPVVVEAGEGREVLCNRHHEISCYIVIILRNPRQRQSLRKSL
jgi:hypothetical protein